jgi:simple sugar transport system permease protein
VLKVRRGVSEVISTIMLNAIATSLGAFLLHPDRLAVSVAGSNNIGTKPIGSSGQIPGLPFPDTGNKIFGLVFLAVLVGVGYHFLLNRTRFGFDLRATGMSASAAVASGVSVRRMVIITMLISGGLAGLIGMPQLLGSSHSFALDFPAGLGFAGIGIALLGRNHPIGIAFGALLFAFLSVSADILDLDGIPKEIVQIMQATMVLSVVIAYEVVRRVRLRQQQREVGAELAAASPPDSGMKTGVPA